MTAPELRHLLQREMTRGAGVLRDAESLKRTQGALSRVRVAAQDEVSTEWYELRNLAEVAACIVRSASAREETRGAHTRQDFPATDPRLRVRYLIR